MKTVCDFKMRERRSQKTGFLNAALQLLLRGLLGFPMSELKREDFPRVSELTEVGVTEVCKYKVFFTL